MLIDDRHPLEASAIGGSVEEEVVAPYVVRIVGTQSHAAVRTDSDSAPFPCSWAMKKPILAPEAIHSFGVDYLSFSA